MEVDQVFKSLGISLGIGLLIGLQREKSGSRFGGVRTFPLIALLGTIAGLLGQQFGAGWIIAAGLLAVVATVAVSNFIALKQDGERDAGMTSEVAALVMFLLGAYAVFGPPTVVLAIGAGVAALLQAKVSLHGLAGRIGERDMRAIMLFAAITFIVLPVLPDRMMGPFNVLNPRHIWLMVVLVVGISLGGYVAYKIFGRSAGTVLGGLLGGLVSSTATTVTYSRRASESPAFIAPAVLVIVIAGGVVYARLLTEVSLVAPSFVERAAGPLLIMIAVCAILAMSVWIITRKDGAAAPEPDNPTELKSALFFALLYAGVTLAVAVGEKYFQNRGIFVVAAISGLTDMDAITLSTSKLVESGKLAADTAWRAILVAAISNMAFKSGIVLSLGGVRLFKYVAIVTGVKIAAAASLIVWWG